MFPNGYPQQPLYQSLYSYQQPQYQYQQPGNQPVQGNAQTSGLPIQVSSIEDARAFLVAPGQTVYLWNYYAKEIYEKSANTAGVASIRIIDWNYRDEAQQAAKPEAPSYVTKDEYNSQYSALMVAIEDLRSEINNLSIVKKQPSRRKEDDV